MREQRPLTPVADALAVIGRHVRRLPAVRVALDLAAGLTTAEPITTDLDHPPFDKAMMDGFAVRFTDCANSPTTLRVVGEVAAGEVPRRPLAAGEALRINTGAPIPPGADAVIPIERVQIASDGLHLTTDENPARGAHVTPRGTDARAGDVVVEAGEILHAGQIAAAAAAGAAEVIVYRRPLLAVLVTGDELVGVAERPAPGRIRNSNGPCLAALARQAGCDVLELGTAGDDPLLLAEKVRQGLAADVLCVSGGVSMGQHDHVPEVLAGAGVRLEIRKIAIKPGKPTVFGIGPDGQTVFGLPGNPVSAFVCFLLFVRAALAAMQGRPAAAPAAIPAVLETPVASAGPREEYLPASLWADQDGVWRSAPVQWQGSGDVFGLARARALLVRPVHAPPAEAGTILPAIPIHGQGIQ